MKKIIPLLIVLGIFLVFLPQALANLDNGLVGYWPFNGNANDESGNGNHGTVNGATLTEDRFGNPNSAYNFDGVDDYITIDDDSTLNSPTSAVTISLWTYPLINSGGIKGSWLAGKDYQYVIWWDHTGANGMVFYIHDGEWKQIAHTQITQANQYYHLLAIYNGNNIKLYINGEEIGSNNIGTTTLNTTINPFTIGVTPNLEHFFEGTIDDIRIYNRAVSKAEIKALFTEGGWKK